MTRLKQIVIDVPNDYNIYGEIEGNEESGRAIVFSHGFGVKRDNKGIYPDVSSLLKNDYLTIKFDYQVVHQDKNSMQVRPFSKQAEILGNVTKWVRHKFDVDEVNIVAQSAGCYPPCILNPKDINKAIFISVPPKGSDYKALVHDIQDRSGQEVNLDGLTKLEKSDGSVRYLTKEFWDDFKKMEDVITLYTKFSKNTDLYFTRALHDHVIDFGDYKAVQKIPRTHYKELPGDHNLSGRARVGLLEYISAIL